MTDEVKLSRLAQCFEFSLQEESEYRDWAGQMFNLAEKSADYSYWLIDLIKGEHTSDLVRLTSVTALKNFVDWNWDEEIDRMNQRERKNIKEFVLAIMPQMTSPAQNQLRETIKIIVERDSLLEWPQLVDELTNQVLSGIHVPSALLTCHSIFKRYRNKGTHEVRQEIEFVVNKLAHPLTELVRKLMMRMKTSNGNELQMIYSSVFLSFKIFYSLNIKFKYMHPIFQDVLEIWVDSFHDVLMAGQNCVPTRDHNGYSLLDHLRSQTFYNLTLLVTKFVEQFKGYLNQFMIDAWLLLHSNDGMKDSNLFEGLMVFFKGVVAQVQCHHIYEDKILLRVICKKLILANIDFTALIKHLVQEVPEDYPMCNSVTYNLLEVLLRNYQKDIFEIFMEYFHYSLKDQRLTSCQISIIRRHLVSDNLAVFLSAASLLRKTVNLTPSQFEEIVHIVSKVPVKRNFIRELYHPVLVNVTHQ